MSYLKIKNPTDLEIKTGYLGEYYYLPAGETKSFPEDLAKRFIEVYPFLMFASEEVKEVEEVKEIKKAAKK